MTELRSLLTSGQGLRVAHRRDRAIVVGRRTLVFEHTALKEAGFKLRESGLIVQALKSLGPDRVTPDVISKIRRWLPNRLWAKVLMDTRTATGWVYAALQRIAQQESNGYRLLVLRCDFL